MSVVWNLWRTNKTNKEWGVFMLAFSERYKAGQVVQLVVQGEGVYHPTIDYYDAKRNLYRTNSNWNILESSIVFDTEEEVEEYKRTVGVHIDHGADSEWGWGSNDYLCL